MRPALLPRSEEDDVRITRAMATLTGLLQVDIVYESRRQPPYKCTRYRAIVTATHYGCTCPDWQYRDPGHNTLCLHLLASCLLIQAEHKQAA